VLDGLIDPPCDHIKTNILHGTLFASGTVFYLGLFETDKAQSSFNGRRMTMPFAAIGLVSALSIFVLTGAQLTGDFTGAFDP